VNAYGCTPLHVACNNGQDVVVDILLQHKVGLNPLNNKGQTPLHYAAFSHHGALCMELLVKTGADPNVQDEDGRTPLHMTALHGFYLRTETLISHGEHQLDYAIAVVPMLRHQQCFVNFVCIMSYLYCFPHPISIFLPSSSSSLFSLLPSSPKGSRVDVEDKEGNAALHIAARHGHASVVKTLVSNGANMFK